MSMNSASTALASRLTRHFAAGAVAAAAVSFTATADVIYTPVNLPIPANIDGLYINVETLASGTTGASVAGWDINPYGSTALTWFNATGTGMMRFPGVTTGSAGNLVLGTPVTAAASYGSGTVTVGTAAGNWRLNDTNYFGFRFVASSGQTHYGWGRMVVGSAITNRTITGLAWESTPLTPITVGDEGGPPPVYDPCNPSNPTVAVGTNTLPVNPTAENRVLPCGTARKANLYRFTAPATRNYDFSTCSGTADTILAVLDDCGPSANVVSCNNDFCGSGSQVTLSATAGATYYIALGSATKSDLPSTYTVNVTPWYDPCDSTNPTASTGNNNLALNTTTAANLSVDAACGSTIYKANFFKYTPTTSGTYTINTCSSSADTRLAVLEGCSGGSVLGCNDDSCGTSSSVTVELFATVPYYIVVGSASPSATLPSPIAVTVVPPPLPVCVDAITANYGDNPFDTSTGMTTSQAVQNNAANTAQSTMYKTVWFKFTPTATGAFTLKTCGAVGSNGSGDTLLGIGTVCPGVGTRFNTIAFNDDAPNCASSATGGNLASWIDATNNGATGAFAGFPLTQDLVAGQTYYIAVAQYSSTATVTVTGSLNISGPEAPNNPADLDGDGVVGPQDLALLLNNWGGTGVGDIDGDGVVGATDLGTLLNGWSA